MIGKVFNTGASGQNQQLNKYLGTTTTDPVIVRGRYMLPIGTTESGVDILVRGEGTNLTNVCNFMKSGEIRLGRSTTANAKIKAGEWIEYVLVIKPDTGKYVVTGYFFGDGILDASGNPIKDYLIATSDTASNTLTDISKLNCRILVRGNVGMSDTNAVYVDDIRIYSPGVFKISMDNTESINTNDGIDIKANHDIAVNTITAANVIVKDANNNPIEVSTVKAMATGFHVEFSSVLVNGVYTLMLTDAATDVVGQKVTNTINFTVQNTAYKAGDVTVDNDVNSTDAIAILRYAIGLDNPERYVIENGDVDGNGTVNSTDAIYILRYGIGLDNPTSVIIGEEFTR